MVVMGGLCKAPWSWCTKECLLANSRPCTGLSLRLRYTLRYKRTDIAKPLSAEAGVWYTETVWHGRD